MAHIVTPASKLNSIPKVDKQIIFVPDSGELYADFSDSSDSDSDSVARIKFGDAKFEARIAALEGIANRLEDI